MNGRGVPIDLLGAARYFKLAADQNHAQGQCTYGFCLVNGHGVPSDLVEAAKYFKLAADQNDAGGQYNYGFCLANGHGVPTDLIGAAKYSKLAADQHHPLARAHYGYCLSEGRGVPVDHIEAAKYYKLAADQNHAAGQYHYGKCLANGLGVPIDILRAANYYKLAADQSFPLAEMRYGFIHQFGLGVHPDDSIAADYYDRAGRHGNSDGLNCFGLCLEFGIGVTKDIYRASEHYRLAANQGNAGGQNNFGFCLQSGLGVEIDLAESAKYYKLSADQNHCGGSFHYALCLHYGIGVETDLAAAAIYYERASLSSNLIGSKHSFRIRRSLNEAKFARNQFYELRDSRLDVLDRFISERPFIAPTRVSEYWVKARIPADGSPTRHGPIIGTGGSSFVTLEHRDDDGEKFAIKHLFMNMVDESHFLRELETLIKLNHPCILRILGYVLPHKDTNDEESMAEIRTEFTENGSLKSVLKGGKEGRIPAFWNPTGIGIIICGIVLGMRFVHSSGFIHRDLKPGNILLNEHGESLIADFGTTRPDQCNDTPTPETGSVHYAAPEQYQDEIECTNKVDVFAFGLILYEILVGCAVFPSSMEAFPVMRLLREGAMPTIPEKCGCFMQNLIPRCWSINPANRPSFNEILNEIQAANLEIIPGADPERIRDFLIGVLAWEARSSSVN
jgi:TPR repeat protein